MPEREYNDHFVICLTPDKGTQVICNPNTIRIFFKLYCSELSIADLTEVTGIRKNTVRDIVGRMLSKGLVTSRADENDGRSTLYRVCASPILIDNNYMTWIYPPVEDTVNNTLDDPQKFQQYFVSVFTRYFAESGIDLRPFHMEAGASLCLLDGRYKRLAEKVESGTIDRLTVLENPDMEIGVTCRGKLELDIRSDEVLSDDRTLIFATLIGMLVTSLPEHTGRNYCHLPHKIMNKDKTEAKVSLAPFDGRYFEDRLPLITERPDGFYRCAEPFAIYSVEGRSYLFKSDIMLRILEELDGDGETIGDLVGNIPYSKISIHSALNKLIDIGAVTVYEKSIGKGRVYRLGCRRVLYSVPPSLEHPEDSISLCYNMDEVLGHYYKIVNTFTMEVLRCIGVDVGYIVDKTCSQAGRTVREKYPGLTNKEYVEIVCSQLRDSLLFDGSVPGTLVVKPLRDTFCYNLGLHYFEKIANNIQDGEERVGIHAEYGERFRFFV